MQRLLHTVGLLWCREDTLLPKLAKCNNFEWEARKERTSTQTAMHMKEVVGPSWTPVALVQDCRFGAKTREDLSLGKKKHDTGCLKKTFLKCCQQSLCCGFWRSAAAPLGLNVWAMWLRCGPCVGTENKRAVTMKERLFKLQEHLEFSHTGSSHAPHLLWLVHARLPRLLFVSKGSI